MQHYILTFNPSVQPATFNLNKMPHFEYDFNNQHQAIDLGGERLIIEIATKLISEGYKITEIQLDSPLVGFNQSADNVVKKYQSQLIRLTDSQNADIFHSLAKLILKHYHIWIGQISFTDETGVQYTFDSLMQLHVQTDDDTFQIPGKLRELITNLEGTVAIPYPIDLDEY